jgi:DNA-binding GntR family transcriptional regulator
MVERTLSEKIAQALASEIISGRLPPGFRLDEQSVALRFSVSRTPVRDALRQLAATRLIEHFPRRGFAVAAIEPTQLEDMYEALSEIEALCASLCARRAGATERSRLQTIVAKAKAAALQNDSELYAAVNEEFHHAIYAGAHNKTLETVAHEMRQRLAPFRSGLFFQRDRLETSVAEHDLVLEAIFARDADAAASAMRDHTARTAVNVLNKIADQQGHVGKPGARRMFE